MRIQSHCLQKHWLPKNHRRKILASYGDRKALMHYPYHLEYLQIPHNHVLDNHIKEYLQELSCRYPVSQILSHSYIEIKYFGPVQDSY